MNRLFAQQIAAFRSWIEYQRAVRTRGTEEWCKRRGIEF